MHTLLSAPYSPPQTSVHMLHYHQAYLYIATQRQKGEAFFTLDKKFIDPKLIKRRYSDSIVSPKIRQIGGNVIVKKKSQSWSGSDIEKALADPALPDIDSFRANFQRMRSIDEVTEKNENQKHSEESSLLHLRRVDEENYGAVDHDTKEEESKHEIKRKISRELRLTPVPYTPVPESWHWAFKSGMAWAIIAITLLISILALVLQINSYVDSALHPTPPCVPNVTAW